MIEMMRRQFTSIRQLRLVVCHLPGFATGEAMLTLERLRAMSSDNLFNMLREKAFKKALIVIVL